MRAALGLAVLMFGAVFLVAFWPITIAVLPLSALGSAVDAIRASRRGAHAQSRYLPAAALALLLFAGGRWLIGAYVEESFRLPSSSMVPALVPGDYFVVEKLSVRWRAPQRGELVAFMHPGNGRAHIKRVVGLAGDTIAMRGQQPILNGKEVPHLALGQDAFEEHGMVHHVTAHEEALGGRRYRVFDMANGLSAAAYAYPPAGAEPPCPNAHDAGDFERYAPADFPAQPPMQATANGTACVVPAGAVFVLGDNRWNSSDSRKWGAVPLGAIIGRVRGIWWPAPSMAQGESRWARLGWVP